MDSSSNNNQIPQKKHKSLPNILHFNNSIDLKIKPLTEKKKSKSQISKKLDTKKLYDNISEKISVQKTSEKLHKNNTENTKTLPDLIIKHTFCNPSHSQNLINSGPLDEKGKLIIPLKTKKKFKKSDFNVISLSGKGAYGRVMKVQFKNDLSGNFYAIKVMDIFAIDRINKLYQAYLECDVLSQLNSPYIVDVLGAFDENRQIYIVMQYLSKGDFSDFLRINFPLKDETIRFYIAEIVNFLHYIQSQNLVHRDLKPENIMMNEKCHLQVIDFATSRILGKYFDKKEMIFKTDNDYGKNDEKIINNENDNDDDDDYDLDDINRPERRGMTFVGTAEYVSPEVLAEQPAGFGSDIWALGIMLYQMYYGKTPFKEKSNYLIFKKIEQLKIDFSPKFNVPEEAKDLILKILVKEPEKRLGGGNIGSEYDILHLKNHPYFNNIDWDNLHNLNPPNIENYSFEYKAGNKSNAKNESIQDKNSIKSEHGIRMSMPLVNSNYNIGGENKGQTTILRKGYLSKKSPWLHYNKRKIVLDSTPKLIYIDPETNKIKGEIYLDKQYKIIHVDSNTFELISPKRSYKFKGIDGDAMVWEKHIIDAIKQYGKQI